MIEDSDIDESECLKLDQKYETNFDSNQIYDSNTLYKRCLLK